MTESLNLAVVIMAGGRGKRMEDDLPKVLHDFGGRSMISRVVDLSLKLNARPIVVVVGYKAELVKTELSTQPVEFALQSEPLGTGHAVLQALPNLESFDGDIVVLSGDVPALSAETVSRLVQSHRASGASATMLAARVPDATGYGRVLTDDEGRLLRVVEHKDANDEERSVDLINSGIYVFNSDDLKSSLPKIENKNKQSEYYLPDSLYILKEQSKTVAVEKADDYREILGVNTKSELRNLNDEIF